jgi:nucleotide-binding universal stress UspA family protein
LTLETHVPSFRRILIAVDGSKNALAACGAAASIAKASRGKITMLYAAISPTRELHDSNEVGIRDETGGAEQRIVDEAASVIGDDELVLERVVLPVHASVVETISAYAQKGDFDLIVMGERGLGGFKRLVLGSVSSGVATHATRPVLVVRSDPSGQTTSLERIMVAVDGSVSAKHAVAEAAKLAGLLEAKLEILHVMCIPEIAYATTRPVPIGDMEEALRTSGEMVLAEASSLAETYGTRATCEIRKGISPAQGIVDYADANQTDLIVVGARGMGGFKKLLLGSVSNTVLHYAGCSVLVVK